MGARRQQSTGIAVEEEAVTGPIHDLATVLQHANESLTKIDGLVEQYTAIGQKVNTILDLLHFKLAQVDKIIVTNQKG